VIAASCEDDLVLRHSVAIDGTDFPTFARLQAAEDEVEADVEEADDEIVDEELLAHRRKFAERRRRERAESGRAARGPGKKRRKATPLAVGPDGRNVWTKDIQARAGHHSHRSSEPAGFYQGYEVHPVVETRDAHPGRGRKKQGLPNGMPWSHLGPAVARLVRGIVVTPAGGHRGRAAAELLLDMNRRGAGIDDVVVDGGYSLARPEYFMLPLHDAGLHVTFNPASHQWPPKSFNDDAIVIGGQLFDARVPQDLQPTDASGRGEAQGEGSVPPGVRPPRCLRVSGERATR
jgi:hypothetical protein